MVSSTAFISTLARCTSLSSTKNSLIVDISRRALYTCLGVDRSTPCLVSLSAVLFNDPPIPSGAPFPWDASKKFHVASEYFSRRVANRKKFRFCRYWEVGPSLKKWTFAMAGWSVSIQSNIGCKCSQIAEGSCCLESEMEQNGKTRSAMYRHPVCRVACWWDAPKWADWISLANRHT